MFAHLEQKQLPFAVGTALTRTAWNVAKAETAAASKVFDRPTRFITHSMKVKPASKRDWNAEVSVMDEGRSKGAAPSTVAQPHIFGGPRAMKRSEALLQQWGVMLPGYWIAPGAGMKLNANGNIPSSEMQRILSALNANFDKAMDSFHEKKKKKRSKNKLAGNIFAIRTKTGHLSPGVYERVGQYRLRPLLAFVRKPAYPKRWDFFGVGQKAAQSFKAEFERAWREASLKYGAR